MRPDDFKRHLPKLDRLRSLIATAVLFSFVFVDGAYRSPAYGAPLCSALNTLLAGISTGDVSRSAVEPLLLNQSAGVSDPEVCGKTRTLSGSSSHHCAWSFPYRSDHAVEVFEGLGSSFQACLSDGAVHGSDPLVNHPDSYDTRIFNLGDRMAILSLKDKAALQKTYVFVRVELGPEE